MKQKLFYRSGIILMPDQMTSMLKLLCKGSIDFRKSTFPLWNLKLRSSFLLLMFCSIQLIAQSPTQTVTAIQYYFNTDPGVGVAGNGAIVTLPVPTANFNQSLAINIPGTLTNGIHNLYIRAMDELGRWSSAERRMFLVQNIAGYGTEDIVAYQYYFNSDPGVGVAGNGGVVNITPTANLNTTLAITVPGTLSEGVHNLYIRTKDSGGQWSQIERRMFILQNVSGSGTEDIVAYQYYFNTDPGVGIAGNGGVVSVTPTSNFNTTLAITVPGTLSEGVHNLYIRTKDSGGQWSQIERRMFILQNVAGSGTEDIVAYQYYFNTDPGVGIAGNGGVVSVTPTSNFNTTLAITVPGTLSEGVHNLYIRTKDSGGQWSQIERRMFILQNISGSGTEDIVAYQYYFNTDPGVGITGNGAVVNVTPSPNLNTTLAINVPGTLNPGIHNLYIRTKDTGGQWSIIERRMFIINSNFTISNVTALEYYFDTDPGVGNGNPYTVTPGANINITANIGVPCLSTGTHYLYVRAKNAENSWSIIFRDTLSVSSGVAASVVTPSGPINICTGNSVMLSAVPVAGATYQWLLNNVNILGATTTSYNANTAGSYTLRTTCGVSFTVSNAVVVNTLPLVTYYADADSDGYGNAAEDSLACSLPSGYVTNNTDCNDANAAISPGDPEGCNGIDDNCNSLIDDGLTFLTYYTDADGDGYGLSTDPGVLSCVAISGSVTNNNDCNDSNGAINPSASETCNGIDDNCNSLIDEGVTTTYYADTDGDGFGATAGSIQACTPPLGYVLIAGDCNDGNNAVNPNATEVCNSIDDDCDSQIDEGVTNTYYADSDGDGFGDASSPTQACTQPVGYVTNDTDCDDNNIAINTPVLYYVDADNDGYGSSATSMICSLTAPVGYSSNDDDCDDINPLINPGMQEVCNGIDDDCDGLTDDADPSVTGQPTWYADTDNDTFGDAANTQLACVQPSGYVSNNTDCDDNNNLINSSILYYVDFDQDGYGSPITAMLCSTTAPLGYSTNNLDCNDGNSNVNPGEVEVCNSVDDNCNGQIDEGVTITYYADADGDGFGNATNTIQACSLPVGYSLNNLDCNDADALEFPGQTWYTDADGDDYGSGANIVQCTRPANGFAASELIATSGDCADAIAAINPGATEICNSIDDDCDTQIDEGVLITYYADADGDTYGDPATSQLACTQPLGYVTNNLDCNDADADQFPGQIWYTDADGDDYGTGATVTQCLRPATGYLAVELVSTTGDCNDNNASINPVSQTLTFSTTSNFQSSLISPASGTSYTTFTFEVIYTDATNAMPPATFPRVLLDYEGNGIFNNTNDRVVIMNEYDVNDVNTSDGKRYIGTINSLAAGTNWQTRIQIVNGACITQTGPFNYPDVLILPDLQIFANDITFSSANPDVSSSQTVTAVIHNTSDYAAQNFYVHLVNQYDNSSPADILISNLAPHSSTTVSWTITTPAVPAWCPMQVSIDYTNIIDESNELDNSALRPFINGNFNLPGGIVVINAAASPSVFYSSTGGSTTISGRALYYGTPVPMADSSVAGGTVTLTILETGATFTANTNSQGYFSVSTPAPYGIGTYNVSGSVTDFTLTGNFATSYSIVTPPACLPDLRAFIALSSGSIIAGNSISGNITVYNYGCIATTINSILDISHSGGTPILNDVTIPTLNPGASFSTSFSNLTFTNAGTYSLCATADGTYLIQESNESNNTDCININVIPAMADIYPAGGPSGGGYTCNDAGIIQFAVGNSGGAATGPFNCEVIVRLNNVVVNTFIHPVANIPIQSAITFGIPGTYNSTGNYTFEIKCDIPMPVGVVTETNEFNNTALYTRNINDCKPDLAFNSCETFDVQPVDPQFPGTVTYVANMVNVGNATANGPIDVRFQLSGGTFYNTQYNGNLAPGQSTIVSVNAPSVAPATQTLSAIADPSNIIDEWNETNTITKSLCWDFKPVPMYYPCGSNFWQQTYLVNQTAFLSVGMTANNLYDASAVKVRFQVSGPGLTGTVTLGDATVNNVEETCNCPRNAVLPVSFAFPQVGTYTFTMTADPDGVYSECNESDNVMIVTVVVTGVPDMRILSQYIDPSMLNPQPGQLITMDITYENLGVSNITDQMELKVLVDEIPLDSVYPVNGLVSGDNITIAIPQTWSSNAPGTHVIRAVIDSDNQVVESNESNNQATRAIIVGEAANLYFQVFESSDPTPALHDNITINATIGNNGDLDCGADIQFFYLTNSLDTIHIGTIAVNVNDNSSTNISLPWNVLDPTTTLIGKIINSSTLEFTYDDNQASTVIGAIALSFTSTQSCNGGNDGTLTAVPSGGEAPYSFTWSNGYNSNTQTGAAGSYSVTVTDNTGQFVSGTGTITNDAGVLYFADADGDTYGNASVSQISCSGPPSGYVLNDDDCNDNSAAVNPGATEVCNNIDDDCDGLIDNNDPSLSDTELPTINCIANIAVDNAADACGTIVTYAAPVIGDNCAGATMAQTTGMASGSFFPVGTTTNTYVVTDFSGNTATCSFDIIVTDTQNPTITCSGDISLVATSAIGANVNYTTPIGTDNCSGSSTAMTSGLASGSTFPIGITTVTYVVTDAAGLTATCSFTVEVIGLAPQIICPGNITVNNDAGQCGAIVSFFATETTGIPTSAITYSHAPGSFFNVGTTTVTATATNSVGNSVCTFDITVNDAELPTINVPSDIIVPNDANSCDAMVTYTTSFNDNCSGATITQTSGLASGASCPVGTTINTFVVTDASGNTTTGSFTVTVIDNTNPSITCPANISMIATGPGGAAVNYTTPIGTDNCSGSTTAMTSGLASGSTFPIGITTVTYVVTDAAGLTATCSFTVEVSGLAPQIVCPGNITVNNDAGQCGAIVSFVAAETTGIPTSAITYSHAPGSFFNVGTTTVTATATNSVGNSVCTFDITVNDAELPTINVPSDIIVPNDANSCDAMVTYTTSFNDNCSGATITQTSGLASGASCPVGTTINTFVVTDASGNTTTGSFTVTVIDNTNPSITCPANISMIATGPGGAAVNYTTPIGTDNCSGSTTAMTSGLASGSTFPIGITTVTYVVTDAAGLTATCSFTVEVSGLAPQIVCPGNITANSDAGQCGAIVSFVATETTGIPSSTITYSHAPGSFFATGTTTVTATATNSVGTSVCTFDVIVNDEEDPTVNLPLDIVVNNDPNLCSAVVTYTTSFNDNCSGATITQTAGLVSGATFPLGTTTNTFVVTDANGNSTTSSFTVTVNANTNLVVNCPANIATVNDAGYCGAIVTYTVPFSGNCSGATIAQTAGLASGSLFPVGTTTNTFVVSDGSGGTATCSFTVTVTDTEDPIAKCTNITLQLDANCNGTLTAQQLNAASTDNCGIATVTASKYTFNCSNVGPNNVVLTVTDIHGNTSTCVAIVTVEDNVAPIASCQPATIYLESTGSVTVTSMLINNGSSDASGMVSIIVSPNTFTCADLGSNAVTLTVTDVNGNVSSCTTTVTVVNEPLIVNMGPNKSFGYGCACADLTPIVTGGCAPYTYMWSTGATTANLNACASLTTNYTVTVTDQNGVTATDVITITKPQAIAQLDRYVILGLSTKKVDIASNNTFYSGAIGNNILGGEVSLQSNNIVTDWLAGHKIKISNNNAIGAVYHKNSYQYSGGNTVGSVTTPIVTPLLSQIPGSCQCNNTSGSTNHTIQSNATVNFAANANIKDLIVGSNATVRFAAGVYCVQKIDVGSNTRFLPAIGVDPSQVVLVAKDDVKFGSNDTIKLNILNPNKTIEIGSDNVVIGSLVAYEVKTGSYNKFTLNAYCWKNCNSTAPPAPGLMAGLARPCQGSTGVVYSVSAVAGASGYIWSTDVPGATITGNGLSALVNFPSGTFEGEVCVQAYSAAGPSTPSCKTVLSLGIGNAGVISGMQTGLCGVNNINYSTSSNNANSYAWLVPAGATVNGSSTLNSINLNFASNFAGGVLAVVGYYNCGNDTSFITLYGKPGTPTISPTNICGNTSANYTATAAGATGYGFAISGAVNSSCNNPPLCNEWFIEWGASGGSLSVVASNACGSSDVVTISTNCRVISGEELFETRVYPNPSQGLFTTEINTSKGGEFIIDIRDLAGRRIYNREFEIESGLHQLELNLGTIASGLYLMSVNDNHNNHSVIRIVVE